MITGDRVTIGDLGIVTNTRLVGGIERAAAPAPRQHLPSTSTNVPISSEMNGVDYSRSSWAFVSITMHTFHVPRVEKNSNNFGNFNMIANWNSTGRLNA
jgi:hypothetical protein